jgi:hypothetical protein
MRSAEDNLGLAQAMLEELEDYLLSAELFWPISRRASPGSPPDPRLTIGNLLLTLDQVELQTAKADALIRGRAAGVVQDWGTAQARWMAGLERKATQEARARLRLWRAFLEDLREEPNLAADYRGEVRNRVILTRLSQAFPVAGQTASETALHSLDAWLRSAFRRGAFVWEAELRSVYPADPYWYLYGAPAILNDPH